MKKLIPIVALFSLIVLSGCTRTSNFCKQQVKEEINNYGLKNIYNIYAHSEGDLCYIGVSTYNNTTSKYPFSNLSYDYLIYNISEKFGKNILYECSTPVLVDESNYLNLPQTDPHCKDFGSLLSTYGLDTTIHYN